MKVMENIKFLLVGLGYFSVVVIVVVGMIYAFLSIFLVIANHILDNLTKLNVNCRCPHKLCLNLAI